MSKAPTPEIQKEFYRFFKKPVNHFWNITGFDVVKFDEYLGTPDGTSMKDFILKKYGARAVELVQSLF